MNHTIDFKLYFEKRAYYDDFSVEIIFNNSYIIKTGLSKELFLKLFDIEKLYNNMFIPVKGCLGCDNFDCTRIFSNVHIDSYLNTIKFKGLYEFTSVFDFITNVYDLDSLDFELDLTYFKSQLNNFKYQ